MGSILGPFIDITPKRSVFDGFTKDALDHAFKDVAEDLQAKLRARLDTGVDLNAAVRASNIKVYQEGGRLIVQAGGEKKEGGEETQIGDLFKSNMQPPTVDNGRLIFRQIRDKEVNRKNISAVESSVKEVFNLKFPEYFERGIKRVVSETPELGK